VCDICNQWYTFLLGPTCSALSAFFDLPTLKSTKHQRLYAKYGLQLRKGVQLQWIFATDLKPLSP